MPMSYELHRGFHISMLDSKVTPTEDGIFIPYCYWGEKMRDLKAFVIKHYGDEAKETFPYLFEDHIPIEEIIAHSHRLREPQSGAV